MCKFQAMTLQQVKNSNFVTYFKLSSIFTNIVFIIIFLINKNILKSIPQLKVQDRHLI